MKWGSLEDDNGCKGLIIYFQQYIFPAIHIVGKKEMDNLKILCLMTYGRSGSKLFHSLLDWHPQVICFPRNLQFSRFWDDVAHKKNDPEFLVDAFINKHPRFFSGESWYRINKYDRANQLGPNMDETFSVNADLFSENVLDRLKGKNINRSTLFLATHLAYHFACGRELLDSYIILYHIHHISQEKDLKACISDFPEKTYLLIMNRHPVQSIDSCVKNMAMQNKLSPIELLVHQMCILYDTTYFLERYENLNIKTLQYEKMINCHKEVMESFVEWMGINWNGSLMKSTMHGKLWWGNGKKVRNGVSSKWKTYHPSCFSEKKEWKLYCNISFNKMKTYGYIENSKKKIKLGSLELLILIFLPTSAEWSVLKSCFSLAHWLNVLKNIRSEIMDPRLQGIDYLRKRELKKIQQINIDNMKCREKLILLKIFIVHLFWNVRFLNPLTWFFCYLKRVSLYWRFIKEMKGNEEKVPGVIL